ncbi:hypothetical protein BJ944DRAFT_266699 [Cunninghamella echinulata]|nr:hypothetical protein BJ944DRAFT_266699 [Cunninghamella echinulata]
MSFRPPKTLPILSIFHNPRVGLSNQALALMQQKSRQEQSGKDIYKIDVIDADTLPTKDQIRQVARGYLKSSSWDKLIDKVNFPTLPNTIQDAETLLTREPKALLRPLVVDWANGMAAVGIDDIKDIEALIKNRINNTK